jgi:Nif-specific regulatory protein
MATHEQELDILEQISQILSSGLELRQVFQRAMTLLSERLELQRAALVLWDRTHEQLETVASVGLSEAERQRGRYAPGEGVTGQVLETGEAAVIGDITQHPDFLNRTGARNLQPARASSDAAATPAEPASESAEPTEPSPAQSLSFICVPIQDGGDNVGAISVDLPARDQAQLQADARLLRIIAGSFAQAVRIHHLVQLEKNQWLEEKEALKSNLHSKYQFDNIIGSSPAMLDVLSTIAQVASSRATVLILGETGCGKELIAKAIHYNSPRADKPMVRVNCAALSPQLLESELFGHVEGAFTGAVRDKTGRFEAADGGTIFLDEVGTLDPQLQIKLLRVLQEREFERVGDHRTQSVDVRVIAATNMDLEEEVRKGNFREDLYYRLNVVTIDLPPLRNRREDIPRLIEYFLEKYNRENNHDLHKMNRGVLNTLLRYPWPGNVRELENAIERAVVMSSGEEFTEDLLPLQIRMFGQQLRHQGEDESVEDLATRLAQQALQQYGEEEGHIYERVIGEVERQLIGEALSRNGGVKLRTADYLGINRNTLNKKVKDLAIPGAK